MCATSRSSYVDELRPRPITRDLDWGVRIPVPGYEEDESKRIYVWIDAVVGYLSAAVEWAAVRGEPDAWREWWQNPDARHYYFMGKDNILVPHGDLAERAARVRRRRRARRGHGRSSCRSTSSPPSS